MNERERQRKIENEAPTTAAYLFLSRRRKVIHLCIGYVYRGASKSHRPPAMADLFAKKVTGPPSRKRARILNVAIRVHHVLSAASDDRLRRHLGRSCSASREGGGSFVFCNIWHLSRLAVWIHGVLRADSPHLEIAEPFIMSPCRN